MNIRNVSRVLSMFVHSLASTNLEGWRVDIVVLDDPEDADELALGADGARREAHDRRPAPIAAPVLSSPRLGDTAGVARFRGDPSKAK